VLARRTTGGDCDPWSISSWQSVVWVNLFTKILANRKPI